MLIRYTFLLVLSLLGISLTAQPQFTRQDTLRGSIGSARAWWDLTFYHLDVQVNPADSTIRGKNTVRYRVLQPGTVLQIDLQPPMEIRQVTQGGRELYFRRDGNAYFIDLPGVAPVGSLNEIEVYFGGRPRVAVRPPWDGGVTWAKDAQGRPFVATSCQGDGASLWWPCKDHMYDEPDSMLISVQVPDGLMDVSNGRLRGTQRYSDGSTRYDWYVDNPINNYGVNVNIAKYVHFAEVYDGEKGRLNMDYYVLEEDLAKAQEQFKQAKMTMQALEYWFGPYPFYEDGYKLVQVPYLGMEHQSSVTYGNQFKNGYLGMDLSDSGWGLQFDFIIIHESGHEWFANSITYRDMADMWIHEGFTAYSENLYLDYHFGKEASSEYVLGTRANIQNDRPLIGEYDVNHAGSGDMYYKGANILHTLRQIVNDDDKWRGILRGINQEFYHQTVTTQQIENYLSKAVGRNLKPFFDQYLRDVRIPVLEYKFQDGELSYRWNNVVDNFDMPVRVFIDGAPLLISPSANWSQIKTAGASPTLRIDPNFYAATLNITGK